MNDIKLFENSNFGSIRVSMIEGQPWFAVADVCKALNIAQPHKAIERLDSCDVGGGIEFPHPQSPEKTIKLSVVNESGLYSLVLGSRKQEARDFKRWITSEVLPTIRILPSTT